MYAVHISENMEDSDKRSYKAGIVLSRFKQLCSFSDLWNFENYTTTWTVQDFSRKQAQIELYKRRF